MSLAKKNRIFCFFCKYNIVNSTNCKNVLYDNKERNVCNFCTKTKHKALEPKYKSYELKCNNCKKATMNKNCIACSICNTFFHGKCLNLTSFDIKKIESIDKSYMCPMCLDIILPRFAVYDVSLKKAKKNS